MRRRLKLLGTIGLAALLAFGASRCFRTTREGPVEASIIRSAVELPSSRIQRVGALRILFGHQSVGQNLIEGLEALGQLTPALRISLTRVDLPAGDLAAGLTHFAVGKNADPDSKLDSFAAYLARCPTPPDVALFKFCFVDFRADTDVARLFAKYKQRMSELRARHPRTTFVHVTVPLTTVQSGAKGLLKSLLGRSTGADVNRTRTRFNELLRNEYAGLGLVFDLAEVESTAPDGSRVTGSFDGGSYEALCPEYTDDGGHLNARGRKLAAAKLLVLLASLPDSPDGLR